MKTVFSNSAMVAHVWAQNTQIEGRSGNMFFENGTIYSYGRHFPLAKIIKNKRGVEKVIINTERRSVTTSKHQQQVLAACSHRARLRINSIYIMQTVVDSGFYDPKTLKNILSDKVATHIDSIANNQAYRANKRKSPLLKQEDIAVAVREYESCKELLLFFGFPMPKKATALIDTLKTDSTAVQAKYEKQVLAEKRAREKKRKAAEVKRLADALEGVKIWLEGGEPSYVQGEALRQHERVYLRLEDDGNIHTSHMAVFPLEHGVKALKTIQACRKAGKAWESNGHTIHLGHFKIDAIDAKGNVKAGCHFVLWEEIERFATLHNLLGE